MLLDRNQFRAFAEEVASWKTGAVALDFETKGLSPHHGARAFLIGCATATERVSTWLTPTPFCEESLRILCSSPHIRYAGQSLKFELSFLKSQFGVDILGRLWDTEVFERVLYNKHFGRAYNLQACAERRGLSKHPPMAEWLKANGHRKNCQDCDHYVKAPEEIIIPYVEQDAWLSYHLMEDQIAQFKLWDQSPVPISPVVGLEQKTTRALFKMEHRGLRLDSDYARRALAYETNRRFELEREFLSLAGVGLVDSRKALEPVFKEQGISYGQTEKGNASFSEEALSGAREHPLIRVLLAHRDAVKRASTYWDNFLAVVDKNGLIHPDIQQTAAQTSRMSIRNPACQTWPDDPDSHPYPIRRAFLADPDCQIVSIDWQQMELRKIADEAGDMPMVEAFKQGKDFHQEVADIAGVPRAIAKNGRFARLYGAGVPRIASTLGITLDEAKRVVEAIDRTSSRITEYSRELTRFAERNGYCYNWLGRRYFFDRGFEYRAPNYRIQGGCGEILRIAIVECDSFLEKEGRPESRILIPIHDEILFNLHRDDLRLIPELKRLMVGAHRDRKHLEMGVTVTVGENFFDQTEWRE